MADTPAWFVESDYLTSKLNQLKELNNDQYGEWDEDDVAAAIEAAGMTSFQHFEAFSGAEGTSPNAYFNVEQYLVFKAGQMNRDAEGGRTNWAPAEVASAIAAAGLTPWAHFQNFGWKEGVSPSESFDVEQYFADKLAQLQEAGEDYENVDQVKAVFAEAGLDPVAHYYAFGKEEGLEPKVTKFLDDLTSSLENYQDAIEARDDFLEAAAEELEVPVEEVVQEIEDGVDDAKEELTEVSEEWESVYGYDFTTASEDALPTMIADVKAEFAKRVVDTTKEVNKMTGLKTAIDAVLRAEDRLADADNDFDDAAVAAEAELDKVNTLNDKEWALNVLIGEDGVVIGEGEAVIDDLIVVGKNNKLEAAEDVKVGDIEGFEALLQQAQAYYDSARVLSQRVEAFDSAVDRVDVLVDDAVDKGIWADEAAASAAIEAYVEALEAVEDFDDAVTEYNDAVALEAAWKEQKDAVDAAGDAIEDLGYHLVEFDEDDFAAGTEETDVFVYIGADEATIDLFGEVGDDVLFIGTEFTFNGDINSGDNAVLEVFFTQDGDNVLVQIETAPFGSNAQAQELDIITLTGVNVEDLAFDQGYVQLAG